MAPKAGRGSRGPSGAGDHVNGDFAAAWRCGVPIGSYAAFVRELQKPHGCERGNSSVHRQLEVCTFANAWIHRQTSVCG